MASPRRGDGGADVGGVDPTGVEDVDDPLSLMMVGCLVKIMTMEV